MLTVFSVDGVLERIDPTLDLVSGLIEEQGCPNLLARARILMTAAILENPCDKALGDLEVGIDGVDLDDCCQQWRAGQLPRQPGSGSRYTQVTRAEDPSNSPWPRSTRSQTERDNALGGDLPRQGPIICRWA